MKKLAIALALIFVAFVAMPAAANAERYRQTGQIVGDKAAKVQLRVKTNRKDKATELAGFKAKGVRTRCSGQVVRYQYNALNPIPVLNNKFKIVLTGSGGAKLTIKGKVKKRGRMTRGSIKSNRFTGANDAKCKTPKQRFKTSTRGRKGPKNGKGKGKKRGNQPRGKTRK